MTPDAVGPGSGYTARVIGVISDTHGLLRPQALAALAGSDLLIHAGDIGKPEVLEQLETIAPVVAVRGNNDTGDWAHTLPETRAIEADGVRIHLLHDLHALAVDIETGRFDVIIAGHSHRPSVIRKNDVLYLNPGSAGPRRFKLPVTVARLTLHPLDAEIVPLA